MESPSLLYGTYFPCSSQFIRLCVELPNYCVQSWCDAAKESSVHNIGVLTKYVSLFVFALCITLEFPQSMLICLWLLCAGVCWRSLWTHVQRRVRVFFYASVYIWYCISICQYQDDTFPITVFLNYSAHSSPKNIPFPFLVNSLLSNISHSLLTKPHQGLLSDHTWHSVWHHIIHELPWIFELVSIHLLFSSYLLLLLLFR